MRICLLFILVSIFSCDFNTRTGHWHLYSYNESQDYYTLDISNFGKNYLNKNVISNYIDVIVNKSNDQYTIESRDGNEIFELEFKKDSLYLIDKSHRKMYFGLKENKYKCSGAIEFFKPFGIEAELPKLKVFKYLNKFEFDKQDAHILYGTYSDGGLGGYGLPPRLRLGSYWGKIREINIYIDSITREAEKRNSNFKCIIFLDKGIPNKKFNSILKEIRKSDLKTMYLAVKSNERTEAVKIIPFYISKLKIENYNSIEKFVEQIANEELKAHNTRSGRS